MLEIEDYMYAFPFGLLFEADYAKNYASILYQCLAVVVRSSLGVGLGRVSSGEPWVQTPGPLVG